MNVLRVRREWALSFIAVAVLSTFMVNVGRTQNKKAKIVLYTGIGPDLTLYDVDVDNATLTKKDSVKLPGSVTEGVFSPSKKFLYVVWGSNLPGAGGGGEGGGRSYTHGISAFAIDPATGALTPKGDSAALPSGPGYVSYITMDIPAKHVMASLTDPPSLDVFPLSADGTLGPEVKQAAQLDFANHPHQVRMDPSNKTVILITRGNVPTKTKPEDPGALKFFSYDNGQLKNTETVAPNGGYHFQARHLDFHPNGKWDYVTLEAQQKLLVYARKSDGTVNPEPLFTKDTLAEPDNIRGGQILGTVRIDRTGKFVYVANRASGGQPDATGKRIFVGGENSLVAFSINQSTGEPTFLQRIDSEGYHPRTISFDPSGKMLVAYNLSKVTLKDGDSYKDMQPDLAVFRVGADGKLTFVRKYDVAVGAGQDWMSITALP